MPRLSLLSDVLFSERLARQGPIPPSIVLPFSLVSSITHPFPKCLHRHPVSLDDDYGVPQLSVLFTHQIVLLGISALIGSFRSL